MRIQARVAGAALMALAIGASFPTVVVAQCRCPECGPRPYGSYCEGPGRGRYGARRQVGTAEEAGLLLEEFYRGRPLTVGGIVEKPWYFEAEILESGGKVADRVIVDRRTGRIRSIY